MATVSLRHIQKIYPNAEGDKPKKKKKKAEEPVEEKSYKLKVTEEGVVAVDDFNLEIQDKEFIVLVGGLFRYRNNPPYSDFFIIPIFLKKHCIYQ